MSRSIAKHDSRTIVNDVRYYSSWNGRRVRHNRRIPSERRHKPNTVMIRRFIRQPKPFPGSLSWPLFARASDTTATKHTHISPIAVGSGLLFLSTTPIRLHHHHPSRAHAYTRYRSVSAYRGRPPSAHTHTHTCCTRLSWATIENELRGGRRRQRRDLDVHSPPMSAANEHTAVGVRFSCATPGLTCLAGRAQ